MRAFLRVGLVVLAVTGSACTGGKDGGASKGTVTIHLLANGDPLIGGIVVFHDADGVPLLTVTTGSDGLAVFDEEPRGGMFTAVYQSDATHTKMQTIGSLDPDDDFTLEMGNVITPPDPTTVSLPATVVGPFAGATNYSVDSGCTTTQLTGTAGTLDFGEACLAPGTVDLIATARDSDVILAYALLTDFDAAGASAVTFGAWQTPVTVTTTIEDLATPSLPAGAVEFDLVEVAGDYAMGGAQDVDAGTGSITLPVAIVPAFGSRAVRQSAVGSSDGQSLRLDGIALPVPATATLSATGDFLPIVTGMTIDTTGSATQPVLRWTEFSLSGVDIVAGTIDWEGAVSAEWQVALPPSSAGNGQFAFPELPAEVAALIPVGDGTFPSLAFLADSESQGFDDLKVELAASNGIKEPAAGESLQLTVGGGF